MEHGYKDDYVVLGVIRKDERAQSAIINLCDCVQTIEEVRYSSQLQKTPEISD